jgi:Lon protease-like protein
MDEALPDLSQGLPVFPLPGITLFPHTHLPLHIFEERYRNLMQDTLAQPITQHCFAMGTLADIPAQGTLGDPPVMPVAGVGRLIEYSRTPDGRYMLVLRGVGRVKLTGEQPLRNGYRVFGCEWLPDVRPPHGATMERTLGIELRALALGLLRDQAERFRAILDDSIELGALTDMVSGYLPFDPEFKLQQMAEANVISRAAHAISELERMLGQGGKPLHLDEPAPEN